MDCVGDDQEELLE